MGERPNEPTEAEEKKRFYFRPPDRWKELTEEEKLAWARSLLDSIPGPEEPDAEETEPIEATIYFGQRKPTGPYKVHPGNPRWKRPEGPEADSAQDRPEEEPTQPSQVTFTQRWPRQWLVALVNQGGLSPEDLVEYEAREQAASQRCEIVRDEEGYETFLCGGPGSGEEEEE